MAEFLFAYFLIGWFCTMLSGEARDFFIWPRLLWEAFPRRW